MKNLFKLLLVVLLSYMFVGNVIADESQKKPVDVDLQIGVVNSDNSNKHPRTLIPITCVYVDGTVQLTILDNLDNLGEMELFVTNQTTGEQWSTVNNLVLQTSIASGVYLVEIVTENGDTYWGTYTL